MKLPNKLRVAKDTCDMCDKKQICVSLETASEYIFFTLCKSCLQRLLKEVEGKGFDSVNHEGGMYYKIPK